MIFQKSSTDQQGDNVTNKVLHCVLGNSNRESLSQKVLKASESGALQTLKSKWWPEGDCTDAAVVGSSAEKSMEVDIPHVGKFWKNTSTEEHEWKITQTKNPYSLCFIKF